MAGTWAQASIWKEPSRRATGPRSWCERERSVFSVKPLQCELPTEQRLTAGVSDPSPDAHRCEQWDTWECGHGFRMAPLAPRTQQETTLLTYDAEGEEGELLPQLVHALL
jgi:hypothetical protein